MNRDTGGTVGTSGGELPDGQTTWLWEKAGLDQVP